MRIIERELGCTLRYIKAGDVFRFNGLLYLKTNESNGFDENGLFIQCVNMKNGMIEDIHENSYVTSIEGRFIIDNENGSNENEAKA